MPPTNSKSPAPPFVPAAPDAPPTSPASVRPPVDYAAVAVLATRAEGQLSCWFDATPTPSIEQISIATQAIWRLAAIRKTLHLAANPHLNPKNSKKKNAPDPLSLQLALSMQEVELMLDLLRPAKPNKSKSTSTNTLTPSTLAPVGLPPLVPAFPRERQLPRWKRTRAPRPAKPDSPDSSSSASDTPAPAAETAHPVAVCPILHAPMHTAKAAARQVEQLCADQNVTISETAPTAPVPAPPTATKPEPLPPAPHRPRPTAKPQNHPVVNHSPTHPPPP